MSLHSLHIELATLHVCKECNTTSASHLSTTSHLMFCPLTAPHVLESQIFLAELMLLEQYDVVCVDTDLLVNLCVVFPRREWGEISSHRSSSYYQV